MDDVTERLAEAARLYSTTRRTELWGKQQGNQDSVHTNVVFPGDGPWELPKLEPETTWPVRLFRYEGRFRKIPAAGDYLHFYMDDYRFEIFWRKPRQVLPVAQKVGGMLGPDFSVFWESPRAVQLYNTYRNRWLSRFAQVNGVRVIPHVSWSDANSLDYCLAGLPVGGLIAISTQSDLSSPQHYGVLHQGLRRLVDQYRPIGLVVYGTRAPLPDLGIEVRRYPTHMDTVRAELRAGKAAGLQPPLRGGGCRHHSSPVLPDHCPCNHLCGCRRAGACGADGNP